MPEDLARFLLSEYNPSDFESPCNTLNELKSCHWSVPLTTETIEDNLPITKHQAYVLHVPSCSTALFICKRES